MKLADALKAIDEELIDLFKDEIHNIAVAVEADIDRRKQLSAGIDRLIEIDRLAVDLAREKFKD